jgi:hypothetical protein
MSYELVLVLVPPDEPEPIERAYELVAPFMHDQAYLCCTDNATKTRTPEPARAARPAGITGMPVRTSGSEWWASYGATDAVP